MTSSSPWKLISAYQRILFPIDGSRDAHVAILDLVPLAVASGATVVVLEVVESRSQLSARASSAGWLPAGDGFLTDENLDALMGAQRRAAEQHEQAIRRELESGGVARVETLVVEGHAGPEIVEAAARHDCDIIVMATHGRSGLSRMFLGSVAEYVLRHAPCPVFLVPAAPRQPAVVAASVATR